MTREGCVCCPYPLLAIPGFLSFVAMILTWVAAFDCHFFGITYYDSSAGRSASVSVGLWTVETYSGFQGALDDDFYNDYGYCAGWNQDYFYQSLSSYVLDGAMNTARAFGMMSSVLSLIAFTLIMIPVCVSFGNQDMFVKIVAAILVFLGVFTILDLVALASDICTSAGSCVLQGSGIVAIVASVLWFVCAGLMFVVMKNPRPMRDDPDETRVYAGTAVGTPEAITGIPADQPVEQREIRTVQNADGSTTTTTTTTVTNADGSKTMTTTTEVTPSKEITEVTPSKDIP